MKEIASVLFKEEETFSGLRRVWYCCPCVSRFCFVERVTAVLLLVVCVFAGRSGVLR